MPEYIYITPLDPNKIMDATVRIMGPMQKITAVTAGVDYGFNRWIYCNTAAGTVSFIDWEGNTVQMNIAQYQALYVCVKQINSSGTTATGLMVAI